MPDLNFLLGRAPITIPNGILPDDFIPMTGSVYDSFAAGLPAVIFLNGEFYPLSNAELEFLKQSFIQDNSLGSTSGAPEALPAMPTFQTSPEEIDQLRRFEQKAEELMERKDPLVEQVKSQESATSTQSIPVTAVTDDVGPKPLVSLEELVNAGKQMVDKTYVEAIVTEFDNGKTSVTIKKSTESLDWLKLLLLKLYRQRFPK